MQKIKIIINGTTIKDDYSTDPSYLIKCELDEELEDVIPSVSIEVKKSIHDLLTLSQSQVVEIYTGSTPVRVFYGYILEIKNEGATTKIDAIMETASDIELSSSKGDGFESLMKAISGKGKDEGSVKDNKEMEFESFVKQFESSHSFKLKLFEIFSEYMHDE